MSHTSEVASAVLEALRLPQRGRIYELASGWWPGMPGIELHPRFDVITYRSPQGVRVQNDIPMLAPENNSAGMSFISELVMGTTHTGSHIDALCHITCSDEWHGGHAASEHLGDKGALNSDATELEPIVARGVCFDIPGALGLDVLPPSFPIGREELERAVERQGSEIGTGDVALIRTGQMKSWPDVAEMERTSGGAGLSIEGAKWLHERGVRAVAGDTAFLEVAPSGIEGNPQPVHLFLIQGEGVPILEWINCEALAADAVYEFLFICLPLTISGATGSMVRPIAIA
jgi:kynurenine formamidase